MPFSIGQIFGGWRKKESKGRKAPEGSPRPPRSRLTRQAGSDTPRVSTEARLPAEETRPKPAQVKGESESAWKVLSSPHISEKATMLGEGKYIFKVAGGANKSTVAQAVGERYGVEVESVRILNMPGKPRRRGATLGQKSGFKKAVVALKKGFNISEF